MVVVIFFVALALTGVMTGIRSLTQADIKAQQAELLQKLAMQKINELDSITDPSATADNGDFAEEGYPDARWTLQVETTDTENVEAITVTATQGNAAQKLTCMTFIRPTTTTGATQ